jgi:hypothetical protein
MFPFFLIRVFHHFKKKSFKAELVFYSEELNNEYLDYKTIALSEVESSIKESFVKQYIDSSSVSSFDTIFQYLYISSSVNYLAHDYRYVDCLLEKCKSESDNTLNQQKVDKKQKYLKVKYKNGFKKWFPNFKSSLFVTKSNDEYCKKFFDYSLVSYEEKDWKDFEKFLIKYKSDVNSQNQKNSSATNRYNSLKTQNKNQLKSSLRSDFDTELRSNETSILVKSSVKKTYKSDLVGEISYKLETITFKENKFDEVCEKVFLKQWKSNSLRTGSTPYVDCFGRNPYCYPDDGYSECSFIKVVTPFNSDVMVTIKKRNRVYKHAYIKAGESYKFKLPNGSYETFFYYGKGWNPNKKMNSSNCSNLRGGFVSNETISKSGKESLYYGSLTYTLQLSSIGNFTPISSNSSEAF